MPDARRAEGKGTEGCQRPVGKEGGIIRGAMRFQVSGSAECLNCPAHGRQKEKGPVLEEIKAEDEESAKNAFIDKKRLCPDCYASGMKANLQFDRNKLLCEPLGL